MNRDLLVETLRTFANDFGVAGLQYAALCSVLREAAAMLETDRGKLERTGNPPGNASDHPVRNTDSDGFPSITCFGYWD